MSRTLILIRHTKSDWGQPGVGDHDRPLNGRGQRDAPRIGAWLAAEGHVPDLALVSSATRTRATWAAIAGVLPQAPTLDVRRDLYGAEPDKIMALARAAEAAVTAIVAHNPGIGECMHDIVARAPDHPRFADIPTGATLVVRFEGELAWGAGDCLGFVTPHDLTG